MALKLTKAAVTKLVCPTGRRETFFWDRDLPGFGVRAFANGRRVWVAQYRNADGRTRRMTIGDLRTVDLDDARTKARKVLAQAQLGQDPQAVRKATRSADSVRALIDEYLPVAQKRLRPRSYDEVRRALDKAAVPIHAIKAQAVTRRDIVNVLDKVARDSGPIAANRVRANLSKFWNWAIRSGRVEMANPVAMTERPAKERVRERVLNDQEIERIWKATGRNHDHDRIVRLLLLTGARREEVGGMRWDEIEFAEDRQTALWTLPADRSKNGLPHEVPLLALAVEQLPKRREEHARVFGKGDDGFSGWSRCKAALDKRIHVNMVKDFHESEGRAPDDSDKIMVADWRLHDLRRTFSTWANETGIEPHVVEAVLNHVSGSARRGVAGTYNRAMYRVQKQSALMAWASHIGGVVGADRAVSNVVSISA